MAKSNFIIGALLIVDGFLLFSFTIFFVVDLLDGMTITEFFASLFLLAVFSVGAVVLWRRLNRTEIAIHSLIKENKVIDDESEQQVAVLMNVEKHDLYMTNKRMVMISSSLNGMKNCGDTAGRDFTRALDELLGNDKKSFAIPYESLSWICLNKSYGGGNLNVKSQRIWKIFKLSNDQVENLSTILPNITALNGKFEINK